MKRLRALRFAFLFLFCANYGLVATDAKALTFLVDYSYDTLSFFNTQAKKDVFEAALASVGDNIPDTLAAITPVAPEHWQITFARPDTGATATVYDPTIAANTLVIYAGGRDLGSPTLAQGGPGGYAVTACFGSPGNLCEQARYRGEVGETRGPTATESAWWGGAITFDTNLDSGQNWYFGDLSGTPGGSDNDFWSVTLHELAHVLGIGIQGGGGSQTPWQNLISGGQFTGANSVAEHGSNVPLDGGLGHWANGTMSTVAGTVTAQEAALDPSIVIGTRKLMTDLDYAGLQDIGWDVSIVPEPGSALLLGLGLIGLSVRRKALR